MNTKDIEEYKDMLYKNKGLYILSQKLFPDYDRLKRIDDDKQKKDGHFENIPYNIDSFINLMKYFPDRDRFIDVGCGTGEKVFLAHLLGFKKSIGIEYTKEYYEYSIKNIQIPDIEFKNMDAFDYDFSHEQVVYLYHPLKYKKPMLDLWGKIIDELPQGAVMIEASPNATCADECIGGNLSDYLKQWGFEYLYENRFGMPNANTLYKRFL